MTSKNDSQPVTDTLESENKLIAERREKLKKIRASSRAFPNTFRPKNQAKKLQDEFAKQSKETLEEKNIAVSIAGRMMLKRVMGRASFATLQDETGKIQIFLNKQQVGDNCYEQSRSWDIGDILDVQGTLINTKRGVLTVTVRSK